MKRTCIFIAVVFVLLAVMFGDIIISQNKIFGNYGDIYLHYYPLKHLVSERIISGSLPLWNPYICAGQPLLANPQSAVFYPLSMLFYFFNTAAALNYFTLIHVFLASFFMYMLLKYLKYSNFTSLIISTAYTFSSFIIYKIPAGHPVSLSGYAYFPLVVLFLYNLAKKQSIYWVILFSFTLSFQFLSGHTMPVYISLIFIFLHFLYNRFCYWKYLAISALITLFICAVQFIPTNELSMALEKVFWTQLAPYYSMKFINLINIIIPDYFGNIIDSTYVFQDNVSYFFENHALYFGILPFIASLYGAYLAIRNKKYFYLIVVFVGLLLALGYNSYFYRSLVNVVPWISFIRVPSRFYYLSLFSLLILSALGFERFSAKLKTTAKVIVLLVLIADIILWQGRFIFSEDISSYKGRNIFSKYLNPVFRVLTQPEVINANKAMLYHHNNINGYEAIYLENYTKYIGLQEKGVFSGSGLSRYNFTSPLIKGLSIGYYLTNEKLNDKKLIYSDVSGLNLYFDGNALPKVFFPETLKEIRRIDDYDQIDYLSKTEYSPDQEIVLSVINDNYSLINPIGTIYSYKAKPEKISLELKTDKESLLVFSEIFYNGWSLWANGKKIPIVRANIALRSAFIDKGSYIGKNRLIMHYNPISFKFGLIMTLTVLSLIVFMAARGLLILSLKERGECK